MATSGDQYLSQRAAAEWEKDSFLGKYGALCMQNEYSADNPGGIVSMGAAENKLCEGIIAQKFAEPEMNTFLPYMQYYFDYAGIKKETIAEFLTERMQAKEVVSADHIVVSSGASGAMDYLAFCLADPGEYFIIFSPLYVAFYLDIGYRSKVNIVEAPLPTQDREDAMAYEQNVKDLAAAYSRATTEGKRVRGVVIVNPHNPTGNIVRCEKIVEILNFCAKHKLHVIINEVYSMTVFDDGARFESVLTLDSVPDPQRLHKVWSFSKDFGMSGMRCGVLYSKNELLTKDRRNLDMSFYLGSVPPIVQEKLRIILADRDWLDNVYFPTNKKLMKDAYQSVCEVLKGLGIGVCGGAGLYVWADFRKYLTSPTEECEMKLFEELFDAGVYIVPGTAMKASEPGWFRVVFTNPQSIMEEGLQRMKRVLLKYGSTST